MFLFHIVSTILTIWCTSNLITANNTTDNPETTFNLLLEGDRNIHLGTNKDLTLVLGVTGSGKSTLVQFLAGNNSQLIGERRGFDFIYMDTNNKISHATTQSQTLFPELVIDEESGQALVDCPGFFDTRNSSLEIATSYFIKKVFDQAEKVKIVFTISHSSVRVGNERRGFTDLLSYAATIISNIDKFKEGVSFVVTKVDNYPPIPDAEIINYIREFLTESKTEIQSRLEDETKMILNVKMVKMIDVMLDNSSGGRIGIFRRPDIEGPISNSTMLQQLKVKLRTMIYVNTKFVVKDENDFNYSLSSESILYIKDVLLPLNDQKINNFFTGLSNDLYGMYRSQGEASNDIYKWRDSLVKDFIDFKNYKNEVVNDQQIKNIMKTCKKHINNVNEDEISSLITQSNSFRKFIVDHGTQYHESWAKPILEFSLFLENLNNWYTFLPDCFNAMSLYDFQSKKDRFLENIGNDVDVGSVTDFLTRSGDLQLQNISVLNEIIRMGMSVDSFIIRDINRVLTDGVKTVTYTCPDNSNFEVVGNFILVSDVLIKSQQVCTQSLKSITILAMDTIFIDSSIDRRGMDFQIIFIAPKWQVIGNVNILLDGLPGVPIVPSKASNSGVVGQNGADGLAGAPGSPGGNFFGMGQVYVGGQNLLISSNGGNGGPGQHGGDGVRGTSGTWPDVPYGGNRDDFINQIRSRGYHFTENAHATGLQVHVFVNRRDRDYDYTINGHPGSTGSNGGLGGQGGLGAPPGNILIIDLQGENAVRKVNNPGGRGPGGDGGIGGAPGGNVGIKYIRCTKVKKYVLMFKKSERWECHQRGQAETGYATGSTGAANANSIGLTQARSPPALQTDTLRYKNIYSSITSTRIDAKFKIDFSNLMASKNI